MADVQEMPAATLGPVDLRLPADPSMSKVLRLAASGVAALGGFSVEEIEEIKLAVSEVLIALIEHGAGEPVDVRFVVSSEQFSIEGSTPVGSFFDIDHPDLALCRVVLDDVCTEHSLGLVGSDVRISAILRRPFAGV
jgi:anti-sigma regulatory factor (Ser/Thr protein kinase)